MGDNHSSNSKPGAALIKNDIVDELYRAMGKITRRQITQYVDFIFETMSQALDEDGSMKITHFGVFETRHKNARMGRNPKTLEEVEITARRVVSFRASEHFIKRLNSEEADHALMARREHQRMLQHDARKK